MAAMGMVVGMVVGMAGMAATVAVGMVDMVATAVDWDCRSPVVSWEVLCLVACCSEQPNQRRSMHSQVSRSQSHQVFVMTDGKRNLR